MATIAIIDYEVGNLANVQHALHRLDMDSIITRDPARVEAASAVVLPGVGAYRDAMRNLKKFELIPVIEKHVKTGKPFLGICLGMQLLFEESEEDGLWEGLALLPGRIVPFHTNKKVPHMGWNELEIKKEHPIVKELAPASYAYFVHSYHLDTAYTEHVVATCEYDFDVPAIVAKDNVIGMQFHPEKSGTTGDRLLLNFKESIQ